MPPCSGAVYIQTSARKVNPVCKRRRSPSGFWSTSFSVGPRRWREDPDQPRRRFQLGWSGSSMERNGIRSVSGRKRRRRRDKERKKEDIDLYVPLRPLSQSEIPVHACTINLHQYTLSRYWRLLGICRFLQISQNYQGVNKKNPRCQCLYPEFNSIIEDRGRIWASFVSNCDLLKGKSAPKLLFEMENCDDSETSIMAAVSRRRFHESSYLRQTVCVSRGNHSDPLSGGPPRTVPPMSFLWSHWLLIPVVCDCCSQI